MNNYKKKHGKPRQEINQKPNQKLTKKHMLKKKIKTT